MPTSVKCPTCEKTVIWSVESKFRPFCSERCKLIDLGEWASESYSIPVKNDIDLLNLDEAGFEEVDFFKQDKQ